MESVQVSKMQLLVPGVISSCWSGVDCGGRGEASAKWNMSGSSNLFHRGRKHRRMRRFHDFSDHLRVDDSHVILLVQIFIPLFQTHLTLYRTSSSPQAPETHHVPKLTWRFLLFKVLPLVLLPSVSEINISPAVALARNCEIILDSSLTCLTSNYPQILSI